jgi:hypothetical protein
MWVGKHNWNGIWRVYKDCLRESRTVFSSVLQDRFNQVTASMKYRISIAAAMTAGFSRKESSLFYLFT